MLARAGATVVMIGRGALWKPFARVSAADTCNSGNRARGSFHELEAVRGADIALFCVKTTDTESTARLLAPLLSFRNRSEFAERRRQRDKIRAAVSMRSAPSSTLRHPSSTAHIKHVGRGISWSARATRALKYRGPFRTRWSTRPHFR